MIKIKHWTAKVIFGIFALDQWFKKKQENTLGDKEIKWGFLPPITLTYYKNHGLALGILGDSKEKVEGLTLGVMLVTFLEYLRETSIKGNVIGKLGYSLIIGGGASNIFDRMRKKGVIDYIQLKEAKGRFKNIIFNIADISIFVGTILMFIGKLISKKK